MTKITALFSDVGGVLLTNGWDRAARRKLAERFSLDGDDFEARHALVVEAFETGRLGLAGYLDRTVFYCSREFTPQEAQSFMFAQSQPCAETLALIARLAKTRQVLLAVLNNESLELNQYRITHFGLREYFSLFLSSCFLGVRKPDERIYKLALEVTQRAPEECLFIDDRDLNVECARREGMHAIQVRNAAQLERELRDLGMPL